MKIDELEPNRKVINLTGKIQKLEEATVSVTGVPVQEGVIADSTGQVRFTLWDSDVGKYKEGDAVTFVTGWCKEFENELQISAGKFGRIIPYKEPEPVS